MEENIPFEQRIAEVCHEANRAYCRTLGDLSQPSWAEAPDWQKTSAINGVQFHLARLRAGEKPSPSASHEKWLEEKTREGWRYGLVKDPARKQHPCFLPYQDLPVEQRMKDYIFSAIVAGFFEGSVDTVGVWAFAPAVVSSGGGK